MSSIARTFGAPESVLTSSTESPAGGILNGRKPRMREIAVSAPARWSIVEPTKNGNSAGTTICHHKPIPSFHYMVGLAGGTDIRCARYATFGTQGLSDAAIEAVFTEWVEPAPVP